MSINWGPFTHALDEIEDEQPFTKQARNVAEDVEEPGTPMVARDDASYEASDVTGVKHESGDLDQDEITSPGRNISTFHDMNLIAKDNDGNLWAISYTDEGKVTEIEFDTDELKPILEEHIDEVLQENFGDFTFSYDKYKTYIDSLAEQSIPSALGAPKFNFAHSILSLSRSVIPLTERKRKLKAALSTRSTVVSWNRELSMGFQWLFVVNYFKPLNTFGLDDLTNLWKYFKLGFDTIWSSASKVIEIYTVTNSLLDEQIQSLCEVQRNMTQSLLSKNSALGAIPEIMGFLTRPQYTDLCSAAKAAKLSFKEKIFDYVKGFIKTLTPSPGTVVSGAATVAGTAVTRAALQVVYGDKFSFKVNDVFQFFNNAIPVAVETVIMFIFGLSLQYTVIKDVDEHEHIWNKENKTFKDEVDKCLDKIAKKESDPGECYEKKRAPPPKGASLAESSEGVRQYNHVRPKGAVIT